MAFAICSTRVRQFMLRIKCLTQVLASGKNYQAISVTSVLLGPLYPVMFAYMCICVYVCASIHGNIGVPLSCSLAYLEIGSCTEPAAHRICYVRSSQQVLGSFLSLTPQNWDHRHVLQYAQHLCVFVYVSAGDPGPGPPCLDTKCLTNRVTFPIFPSEANSFDSPGWSGNFGEFFPHLCLPSRMTGKRSLTTILLINTILQSSPCNQSNFCLIISNTRE